MEKGRTIPDSANINSKKTNKKVIRKGGRRKNVIQNDPQKFVRRGRRKLSDISR